MTDATKPTRLAAEAIARAHGADPLAFAGVRFEDAEGSARALAAARRAELRRAILLELAEHLTPEQLERARGLEIGDLVQLLGSLSSAD